MVSRRGIVLTALVVVAAGCAARPEPRIVAPLAFDRPEITVIVGRYADDPTEPTRLQGARLVSEGREMQSGLRIEPVDDPLKAARVSFTAPGDRREFTLVLDVLHGKRHFEARIPFRRSGTEDIRWKRGQEVVRSVE